jgi:C4-dicarboxylate-specific signal transduction histidine kinase
MTDGQEVLAIEGVRFFGEISASVSHEIKNVLAIINENAGLLQDMIAMHEKGVALVPERLSRMAHSIARQVTRGDDIVRNMNRFAHSADDASEPIDVIELVQFMNRLADRLIGMKGHAPVIEACDGVVMATTNRFFLENLVWNCLCRAMAACPEDQSVSIRVDRQDARARIRYGGLDRSALAKIADFPSPGESAAARLLNIQLTIDKEAGEIGIFFA